MIYQLIAESAEKLTDEYLGSWIIQHEGLAEVSLFYQEGRIQVCFCWLAF